MELVTVRDSAAVGAYVAGRVVALIAAKPDAVIGMATGATMLPVFAALIDRHRKRTVSFARARLVHLDELVGYANSAPGAFGSDLEQHMLAHIDVDRHNVRLLNGRAADLAAEAAAHEAQILAWGGIDLQLLGIGMNGHIGINEPGSDFASRTRVATLADTTKASLARGFAGSTQPETGLTLGIGTIREARAIILAAIGPAKAAIVARALKGLVSPDCPATALRDHPACTVVVDQAAAAAVGAG